MDITFEKINNYSGKGSTPSNKIGGWFSPHELFRKAKKTGSTIVGLQESSRQNDIDFQIFSLKRRLYATKNFRPRNRPSTNRDYQLVWKAPKNCVRGIKANFFYFQQIKTWNKLPKEIVGAIHGGVDLPTNL